MKREDERGGRAGGSVCSQQRRAAACKAATSHGMVHRCQRRVRGRENKQTWLRTVSVASRGPGERTTQLPFLFRQRFLFVVCLFSCSWPAVSSPAYTCAFPSYKHAYILPFFVFSSALPLVDPRRLLPRHFGAMPSHAGQLYHTT